MKRLAAMVMAFAAFTSAAATFPVDDSQSLPREANVPMNWRSLAPNRAIGNGVEGTTIVTVRLDTRRWVNQNGKIYISLPAQSVGEVSAEWSTQGKLIPGKVVSGNRTLVFSGPIKTATLEDTIALKISADGRQLSAPQRLQFNFEIDVE